MKAFELKCNSYIHPLQVDTNQLAFSWIIPLERNGISQSAYRILVFCECQTDGEKDILWDSGKVLSNQSIRVPYTGKPLKHSHAYKWTVKFWDNTDIESDWSDPAGFETGLMHDGWMGKWIGYDALVGEPYDPSTPFYCADSFDEGENTYYLPPVPYLRHEFNISKAISSAKLYISAFGLVETELNGEKVSDDWFCPGLSDYSRTVYSRAYDVSSFLTQGQNAIGVILADGWYAGYMGLTSREWYGSKPRFMLQLEVKYADGTSGNIVSDEHWRASYGPLLESDIFQGETYDATCEHDGWSLAGFDFADWSFADVGAEYELTPTPHLGEPVVEHRKVKVIEVIKKDDNTSIFDFGECFSGVVELSIMGPRGSRVVLNHAEMLGSDGELYLRGNRSARAMDTYVLKGSGREFFRPRFTFHGFRYAQITGLRDVEILDINAVLLGSRIPVKTDFKCSSELVCQILDMVRLTQVSNQLEIPTDTNARDERLGWGMEGHHFLYSTSYLGDNENFIRKWVKDIWGSQRPDGSLEPISPPLLMDDVIPFAGDLQSYHGVYMIYALYKIYGDIDTYLQYYEQVIKYFDYVNCNSDRHIRLALTCDWLGLLEDTGHSDLRHGYGDCSPGMLGTAHYAIATEIIIDLSKAAGKGADVERFSKLLDEIKLSYAQFFIQRDGSLRRGNQADYLMALRCEFFPEKYREQAVKKFLDMLLETGRVYWKGGMPSTPYFLPTLKRYGFADIANSFMVSKEFPGLGYMLSKGSTSIWERWDAIFEDGTFHPHPMNAFNHIGISSVGDYLIRGIAGIDVIESGFKKILIEPGPSKDITSAS